MCSFVVVSVQMCTIVCVKLFVGCYCLVGCGLFVGCFVVCVLLLRACCLFASVCGLSMLAIVARCFVHVVVAYSCCLPFVVV